MATLETTFAGLKLKNPIIISSSGLTDSAAKNQKLYEAGAGAIGGVFAFLPEHDPRKGIFAEHYQCQRDL